jgi:hypothetical protein
MVAGISQRLTVTAAIEKLGADDPNLVVCDLANNAVLQLKTTECAHNTVLGHQGMPEENGFGGERNGLASLHLLRTARYPHFTSVPDSVLQWLSMPHNVRDRLI